MQDMGAAAAKECAAKGEGRRRHLQTDPAAVTSQDGVRPMYCNQCGAANEDKSKFCGACGAPLRGAAATDQGARPQATGGSSVAWMVAAILLALALAGTLMYVVATKRATAQDAATPPAVAAVPVEGTAPGADAQPAPTTDTAGAAEKGTEPRPAPAPSEDPVAQATVVLENYLSADLGHDGKEMAKYLGGNAAARFRPEVQGQEDLTVHSKVVTGHTVVSPNEIHFEVAVQWSPSDSEETKTDIQKYVVKRTDKGWKIVSTPEYP